MKNLQPYNSIAIILLIAYLCIGFIPNWEAVDKIAPQWLGMNILNVITIIFIFYQKEFYLKSIDQKFRSTITLIYGGFILWAGFSYFYALNPTEVIVNISRQFGVFIMYLSMGILIYPLKNKPQYFSWIITAILTIETYLLATFSMFYKTTTNENKKLIFKSFLQDESRHVAHFIRLLKQARIPKEHIDQADRRIILNILDNSNFELIALIKYLRDIVKNKDKQSAIINNVYKDIFHQTFKHIYLTKCWQFYNILHPNVSEQDFVKIIDDFDVLNLEYRGRLQ